MDKRYLVVGGACLTQFTIIGLLFSYGLFFAVFEAEFGWSRTLLSACNALAFFVMGVLAIQGGRLNDRFGPRRVLLASGAIYGVGFALISQVSEAWHLFVLFGGFIGVGLATHDVVTLSTVARWFEKRRGAMSGVVKVGTALGQVSVPPIAAFAIAWLGWRDASLALGFGAFCLLMTAALLMKAPERAAADAGAAAEAEDGATYAEARAGRVFWTICAIQFLFFPTLTSVPLHVVVYAIDLGASAPAAALVLSVIGGSSVAGRLVVGALHDRIGGRLSYMLCLAPLGASLAALLFLPSTSTLYVVMAVYGFGHGGLFTLVSPTVAEYFGMRAHGAIFGTVLFFGAIGGAIGPIAVGAVFDLVGSYGFAFAGLAAMAAAAAALALTLPNR